MEFYARVKKGSYIDKAWKGQNRSAGRIGSVLFKLVGDEFKAADPLTDVEVAAFQRHRSVVLEMIGVSRETPAADPVPATPTGKGKKAKAAADAPPPPPPPPPAAPEVPPVPPTVPEAPPVAPEPPAAPPAPVAPPAPLEPVAPPPPPQGDNGAA